MVRQTGKDDRPRATAKLAITGRLKLESYYHQGIGLYVAFSGHGPAFVKTVGRTRNEAVGALVLAIAERRAAKLKRRRQREGLDHD